MKYPSVSFRNVLGATALLLLASTGSSTGDWMRDFRGEVSYDDNLSNSALDADKRDDFCYKGQVRFGRFDELTNQLSLALTADVDGSVFARFEDFDNLSVGATASLRYRFALGAMSPFVRVEASGGYATFNQQIQDGGWGRGEVTVGKRLTERLSLSASYFLDHFEGRIRVFQRTSNNFAVGASFDVTSRTQVTASYELRYGEVVSYNVPPRPDIVPLTNAILMGVDTFGFGPAPDGTERLYNAYNLDAMTHTFTAGISQGITDWLAVSVRYERQQTSRAQLFYADNIVRASIHASF